jgi:hypothetical protein
MDIKCVAIRTDGTRCQTNRRAYGDGQRCGVHHNSLTINGPNTTLRKELGYINKKETKDFQLRHEAMLMEERNRRRVTEEVRNYFADYQTMKARHQRAMTDLINIQEAEILRTGIDPDAVARQQAVQRRDAANARAEHRHQLLLARVRRIEDADRFLEPEDNHVPVQPVQRELRQFAADPQNVHTLEAVRQTKEIVERIRRIPVPEDYRWNNTIASKTPFEIGWHCKLSQRAAWQMMSQYAQEVAIYDIEVGIYGKVLDSVWQYVKNSSDKEDLCRVIKQEMEDNVGMCAQGNLSRICNVLAGYMEGVGAQESVAEILGRELPLLMSIQDEYQRLVAAHHILRNNMVPEAEWSAWLDALHD